MHSIARLGEMVNFHFFQRSYSFLAFRITTLDLCHRRHELTLTLILGEGANYLTLRVQFYANECNEGRDTNL